MEKYTRSLIVSVAVIMLTFCLTISCKSTDNRNKTITSKKHSLLSNISADTNNKVKGNDIQEIDTNDYIDPCREGVKSGKPFTLENSSDEIQCCLFFDEKQNGEEVCYYDYADEPEMQARYKYKNGVKNGRFKIKPDYYSDKSIKGKYENSKIVKITTMPDISLEDKLAIKDIADYLFPCEGIRAIETENLVVGFANVDNKIEVVEEYIKFVACDISEPIKIKKNYYENGVLRSVLKSNKKNESYERNIWYSDGEKLITYKNGLVSCWYHSGTIVAKVKTKNGVSILNQEWYENGNKAREDKYLGKSKYNWKKWREDGSPIHSIQLKKRKNETKEDGVEYIYHGKQIYYDSKGILQSTARYNNGQLTSYFSKEGYKNTHWGMKKSNARKLLRNEKSRKDNLGYWLNTQIAEYPVKVDYIFTNNMLSSVIISPKEKGWFDFSDILLDYQQLNRRLNNQFNELSSLLEKKYNTQNNLELDDNSFLMIKNAWPNIEFEASDVVHYNVWTTDATTIFLLHVEKFERRDQYTRALIYSTVSIVYLSNSLNSLAGTERKKRIEQRNEKALKKL